MVTLRSKVTSAWDNHAHQISTKMLVNSDTKAADEKRPWQKMNLGFLDARDNWIKITFQTNAL